MLIETVFCCIIIDEETPIITHNLVDLTLTTNIGSPHGEATWNNTVLAMDNSGFVTLTSNYQPGDVFPIGKTEVVYSATDPSGNSAIVTFVVTVTGRHKPVFLPMYTLLT